MHYLLLYITVYAIDILCEFYSSECCTLDAYYFSLLFYKPNSAKKYVNKIMKIS